MRQLNEKQSTILTFHEIQCALCSLKGMTVREISSHLNISVFSVELYLDNIKNKLDSAAKNGLIMKFENTIRKISNPKNTDHRYFLQETSQESNREEEKNINLNNKITLKHKDSNKSLLLPPQLSKCYILLIKGHSTKEIAVTLNLSSRTVDHYLERLRKLLGCRTSKEIISIYCTQQNSQ